MQVNEDEVHAFMAMRPQYTESHAREIAEYSNSEGIPFCRCCDDWHYVSEACSK